MLEAIWQVMPDSKAEGVWTTHGDLALPLLTTERDLAKGDVLWTDASITYAGTARTSAAPGWSVTDRRRASRTSSISGGTSSTRCSDVTKAGATSGDLARAAIAANGGSKPWLAALLSGPRHRHQRGRDADDRHRSRGRSSTTTSCFPPGMVLVLEPVVFQDGTGGYRSEEIVVITEDGWSPLTDYTYAPYGD